MPVYPYRCLTCEHKFDIVKTVANIDSREICPSCQTNETARYIVPVNFTGASDWDKASYNYGLGCVTKNNKHAAQIAKERGLVEVGGESHETIAKRNAKARDDRFEKDFDASFKPIEGKIYEAAKARNS